LFVVTFPGGYHREHAALQTLGHFGRPGWTGRGWELRARWGQFGKRLASDQMAVRPPSAAKTAPVM
jgi:hypothetical protein